MGKISLKKLIALFIFTLKLMSQQNSEQVNNRRIVIEDEEVVFDEASREEFLGVATKLKFNNSLIQFALDLLNDGSTDQAQRALVDLINWNKQQIALYKPLLI